VLAASGRHRFAQFTVAFAAFVIFAGAMVTSTGSGMAVPDWPKSFGTWMPPMQGGVFYEHGHRMVAGTLGFLVLIQALWSWVSEPRSWARAITWGALVAVIAQAGLGGLTVLLGTSNGWTHTHPVVSAMHASLAQALFALLVTNAVISARGWDPASPRQTGGVGLAGKAAWLPVLIYAQIILGAAMRQQHVGLIIADFPLSQGRLIPVFYNGLVALNFAHRSTGWLVLIATVVLGRKILGDPQVDPWIRHPTVVLVLAVSVQFLLGASAVWTHLTIPALTSAHVLGASVLFTASLVLALRLRRLAKVTGS
jgi:cytochrome c oxidase assembly protein subunit 15